MKYLAWFVTAVVLLLLTLFCLQLLASERVEVIEVHGQDPDGSIVTTRLWVVDYQDGMYVRVGADGSGWFARMQTNPKVAVTRKEQTLEYQAIPRPELSEEINKLMQAKYTWGDTFIGYLFGSREGSIPILLQAN